MLYDKPFKESEFSIDFVVRLCYNVLIESFLYTINRSRD